MAAPAAAVDEERAKLSAEDPAHFFDPEVTGTLSGWHMWRRIFIFCVYYMVFFCGYPIYLCSIWYADIKACSPDRNWATCVLCSVVLMICMCHVVGVRLAKIKHVDGCRYYANELAAADQPS
jgi:hypothetical protein